MTTTRFIPFGLEDDDVEEFFALTEELSEATLQLLRDWAVRCHGVSGSIRGEKVVKYASAARLNLKLSTRNRVTADNLMQLFPETADLLKFIQFLLFEKSVEDHAIELDGILWRGHAAWTVTEWSIDTPVRLTRRLPEGVAEAVRNVVSRSEKAGQQLTRAWNAAYGVDENAPFAYSCAIKAVEILACPRVAPGGTLGGVIRELWQKGDEWTFVLTEPNPTDRHPVVPVEVVASSMKMLWRGQVDRHGSNPDDFRDASTEEARAAVLLAATLVGWLNDGYLVKS